MSPQILLAYILQALLLQTNLLHQFLYALLFENVFLFECSKLYLTNFMNTPILAGIKITYNTFSQYYYIPFLEKLLSIFIHDCIECQRNKHFNLKFKLLLHNRFQNMLRLLITAFLWTLKDLLTLLHTTNLKYMSKLTLSVTLLLQYPSNRITLKLQSKPFYTIGSLNLDHE